MTAIESSWCIGEVVLESNATITVNGASSAVIAAGFYYLRDPSTARSLIDTILAAVTPHMTTPAIFVARDRRLRVTAGASFTWAIPAALQAALGFGASIASTTSATATAVSNLLWSPGWPETTLGHPVGTRGWEQPNRVQTASASGLTVRTTLHGTASTMTGLRWQYVKQARVWTTDEGEGGEYRRFWRDVLVPGRRWKLYSGITEDEASAASVTYTTPKGPYVVVDPRSEWWDRAIPNVDSHTSISLDAMLTAEAS